MSQPPVVTSSHLPPLRGEVRGEVVRLRAPRAPVEPKTHAAWLGAGGGAAFGSIIVGLIQAWITRKALDPSAVSFIDTICAAAVALVSSWLAPHQVRPGDVPLPPAGTPAP